MHTSRTTDHLTTAITRSVTGTDLISPPVAEFDNRAAGAELNSSEVELGELRPPQHVR